MIKWRWLRFDFIPAEIEVDAATRRAVRRAVKRDRKGFTRRGGLWRVAVGIAVVLPTVGLYLWVAKLASAGLLPAGAGMVAQILLMLISYFVGVVAYAPIRAGQTYPRLRVCGVEVCATCGYWLRKLPAETRRCPECGEARVDLPPPPEVAGPAEPDPMPPRGFDQWRRR